MLVIRLKKLLKEQEEQIKNRDESLEKAREEIKWLRGMLKEQEAVEPRNTYSTTPSGKVIPHIFCGKCNKEIYAIYNFCPFCGQAVKWNE